SQPLPGPGGEARSHRSALALLPGPATAHLRSGGGPGSLTAGCRAEWAGRSSPPASWRGSPGPRPFRRSGTTLQPRPGGGQPDPYVEAVERLRVGAVPEIAFASQLIRQGRVSQAIAELEGTVHRHPESYDALLALGNSFLKLRPPNYPAAEKALREAVRRRLD